MLINEYETARVVWTQLKTKYSKTDNSTARINMFSLQKFVLSDDSTIDGSWTKLIEYRQKVISAKKSYVSTYLDDILFYILKFALHKADKYVNVPDEFLTENLTFDESLEFLKEKRLKLEK